MSFKITDNTDENHMTAAIFKRAVKIAGLNLPTFNPATVNTPEFTPATAAQVSDAAYATATAGKDPSTDKTVLQLLNSKLLGDQIGGMYQRNQVALSRAELQHYKDQAPALLEELRTAFEDAVETMTEALPVLGHMDLEDGLRQIGNIPERKAQAITAAYTANKRTAHLIDALAPIAEAVNGAGLGAGGHYGNLTYTKPSRHQFTKHGISSHASQNQYGRKHNVWDLLNDGVPVELATKPENIKERLARLDNDDAESQRNRRAEDAAHAEARAQGKAMGFF